MLQDVLVNVSRIVSDSIACLMPLVCYSDIGTKSNTIVVKNKFCYSFSVTSPTAFKFTDTKRKDKQNMVHFSQITQNIVRDSKPKKSMRNDVSILQTTNICLLPGVKN